MINKKRKEYRDAGAKDNIDKLHRELLDVKNIMTESFEILLMVSFAPVSSEKTSCSAKEIISPSASCPAEITKGKKNKPTSKTAQKRKKQVIKSPLLIVSRCIIPVSISHKQTGGRLLL